MKFSIGGSHPDMHLKPGDRRAPLSGSKVSLVAEPPPGGSLPEVFAEASAYEATACGQAAS